LLKSPNLIYQKFSTTLQISSSYKKLHNFCLKIIQEHPEIIFKSQDFHLLNEDTLLILLRNKKLNLKEIEKWESIIRWGNYHTFKDVDENFNEMPDISLWTKVKFRDLANTLAQITPLINFYQISSEDFYMKVKPFKKVVGKQLYEEILQYHLSPKNEQNNQQNDKPEPKSEEKSKPKLEPLINNKVDSKLITINYFRLIAGWINNESSNRYQLSLLLRGSRDGFTAKKFHKLCDNKGATLSILRVSGMGEIIGGYNPVSWDKSLHPKNEFSKVAGSFVFKLDRKDIDKSIIGRPHISNFTIGNNPNHGPVFVGALYIKGGNSGNFKDSFSMCKGNTYNISIIKNKKKFSVEEYEVYQVIECR
jgi:hypothetical protein